MGNCECVTSRQASYNPDQPCSPKRSEIEDAFEREAADEERSVNDLRTFKCQTMTGLKSIHLKAAVEEKSRILTVSRTKTHVPDMNLPVVAEQLTEREVLRLRSLKIDPKIFINIKKGNVSENYDFIKLLGEGTYGKVMLVTQKKTGLKRALKSKRK